MNKILLLEPRKILYFDQLFIYNILDNYSTKIAGFDLDNTIINTISGNTFPRNKDDWKIKYKNVIPNLKKLHEKNYSIIIFTNQNGIGKNISLQDFIDKCEDILRYIGLPITFYISLKSNNKKFRKPNTGMLEYHYSKYNIDKVNSFYIGDAWSKIYSWNDSDLKFAKNFDIEFFNDKKFFG